MRGVFHLLAIGIDKYRKMMELQTAVCGAEALKELLVRDYQFSPRRASLLPEQNATRTGILNAFRTLARSLRPQDSVVIYYAGHGWLDELGMGYWIPINGDLSRPSGLVEHSALKAILGAIRARHVLLISDSCFAGDFVRPVIAAPTNTEVSVARAFLRASREALTSGGLEPVRDGGAGEHSVFTGHLLRILRKNSLPHLSARPLFDSLRQSLPTQAFQEPQLGDIDGTGAERDGSFVFFRGNLPARSIEVSSRKAVAVGGLEEFARLDDGHSAMLRSVKGWRALRTASVEQDHTHDFVLCAAFRPPGRTVVVAGSNRLLALHDFETGSAFFSLSEDPAALVRPFRWPFVHRLDSQGNLRFEEVAKAEERAGALGDLPTVMQREGASEADNAWLQTRIGMALRYRALALSHCGRFAACCRSKLDSVLSVTEPGRVDIWDLELRKLLRTFPKDEAGLALQSEPASPSATGVAFSPDDLRLACGAVNAINVYPSHSDSPVSTYWLPGHRYDRPSWPLSHDELHQVAFDPTGQFVVGLTRFIRWESLHIWDATACEHLAEIEAKDAHLTYAFSASGRTLAIRDRPELISIRHFPSTQEFTQIKLDSPDGSLLGFIGPSDLLLIAHCSAQSCWASSFDAKAPPLLLSVWDIGASKRIRSITLPRAGMPIAHITLPGPELRLVTAFCQPRGSDLALWTLGFWRIAVPEGP